jgi:predicted nucleic acid-binding protein
LAERPAVNASPLILLARAGLPEFLRLAGPEIVVPSAVLAWAHAHPGTLAIVDDLAGRRCAAALRIPVRGTLGLVLTAKQRGQIKAARPVLESMRASGMYLSDGVMNRALALVGE